MTALTDVVTLRIEIDNFLQVLKDHFHLVLGLIRIKNPALCIA